MKILLILLKFNNMEIWKTITDGKNKFYKPYFVHRLVASAFVDNPNNYPCVNHKDENNIVVETIK